MDTGTTDIKISLGRTINFEILTAFEMGNVNDTASTWYDVA